MRVDADRELRGVVAGATRGLAIEVDERDEPPRLSADDRERERQAEPPRAHHGFGVAADRDPDRKRILDWPRIHRKVLERRAMLAGPVHALSLADAKQELELLLEQVVVVGEVIAEERE